MHVCSRFHQADRNESKNRSGILQACKKGFKFKVQHWKYNAGYECVGCLAFRFSAEILNWTKELKDINMKTIKLSTLYKMHLSRVSTARLYLFKKMADKD